MIEQRTKSMSWLGIAILLLLLAGAAVVQLKAVYRIVPAEWSDLYPQWRAVGAALHGEDPYSTAVTREIQMGFYGHVLGPGETVDEQSFVYPAHLIFLLGPLTLLPWPLVRIGATVVAPVLVLAMVWLWASVLGLRHGPLRGSWGQWSWLQLSLLAVLAVTSWPAVWAYQQTQPTIFVAAVLTLAVFLFQRGQNVLPGILLALATVKPNLVGLIVIWLLFLAARDRRWKFWIAFGVSFGGLILGTEAIVPGWLGRWVLVASVYANRARKGPLLTHFLGQTVGSAASVLLVLLIVWWIWRARRVRVESAEFGACAALLAAGTVCLIPTSVWMIYNELLLLPAVVVLLVAKSSGWRRAVRNLGLLVVGWTLIVPAICAVSGLAFGSSRFLILLPFKNLFVPLLVMCALFCVDVKAFGSEEAIGFKTPIHEGILDS